MYMAVAEASFELEELLEASLMSCLVLVMLREAFEGLETRSVRYRPSGGLVDDFGLSVSVLAPITNHSTPFPPSDDEADDDSVLVAVRPVFSMRRWCLR